MNTDELLAKLKASGIAVSVIEALKPFLRVLVEWFQQGGFDEINGWLERWTGSAAEHDQAVEQMLEKLTEAELLEFSARHHAAAYAMAVREYENRKRLLDAAWTAISAAIAMALMGL